MKYDEVFPNRYTFICVIHVYDKYQALTQAKIAFDNNADGIFLINHSISYKELISAYYWVRSFFNDKWIGINCLDLKLTDVFRIVPSSVDGIWSDDSGISEYKKIQDEAELIQHTREISGWKGIYFGSVAFKYKEKVQDLKKVTQEASRYVDVITTSGDRTGSPPSIEKISEMAKYIGNKKLAIASGMTPENIKNYKDADCFLVATGISKSTSELEPNRVHELSEKIKLMIKRGE